MEGGKRTSQLAILKLVFVTFAMARTATNQWLIVYFFDYFNIFNCDILFGTRLGIRFIAGIIWGYLGDYFTNRKLSFFIIGHIISAILTTLFLYKYVIDSFYYVLITISIESFFGGCSPLLDTITVMITEKNTYGESRFYWALGVGVGAVLCGIWSYQTNSNEIYIYFYDINIALTCIILLSAIYFITSFTQNSHQYAMVYTTSPDNESENEIEYENNVHNEYNENDHLLENAQIIPNGYDMIKEYFHIISTNPIVIIFIIDLFIFGIVHAFVQSSLFIYLLNEFNATQYLCGLTVLSMICGELIIFYFSKWFLTRFGIIGLLMISHISYAIRVIIYTFIPKTMTFSYLFLGIEPLHGFTFAGMWIASIEYASRISPIYLKATIIGTVYGVYNGLGTMFGTFLAGYIYQTYGPDFMFRCAGIFVLIWMIIVQIMFRFIHYFRPSKYTKAML